MVIGQDVASSETRKNTKHSFQLSVLACGQAQLINCFTITSLSKQCLI